MQKENFTPLTLNIYHVNVGNITAMSIRQNYLKGKIFSLLNFKMRDEKK